jgi:hypothetical protein
MATEDIARPQVAVLGIAISTGNHGQQEPSLPKSSLTRSVPNTFTTSAASLICIDLAPCVCAVMAGRA